MALDLSAMTLASAARALRTGACSSRDLTEAALARIDAGDRRLNAFILVCGETARAQAARADEELGRGHDRGPLHGLPISIKDLFDMEGLPTTAASRVREGHVAAADAPAVARLREAGAVLVGKTNLHEFALGTTSEDSAFGPVHHPLDPTRSAGGSSGGSAASVVAGMCLATLGSDTGGSIRIPAAACGLVGLKPAFGEVSCQGAVALSRSLDHVGPLTRTVKDARLVYVALLGQRLDGSPSAPPALGTLRAGLPSPYLLERLQPAVRESFDRAVWRLRAAGLSIDAVTIPHAADAPAIYLPICLAEAAALHARTLDHMPEAYTEPVRLRLELGRSIPAEDYVRAHRGQELLRREVDAALSAVDALILPTLPIVAPPLGASTVPMDPGDEPVRAAMLRLTQPFNLTGHPAMTIPIDPSPDGLPIGLQIVGQRTPRLLDVAAVIERVLSDE